MAVMTPSIVMLLRNYLQDLDVKDRGQVEQVLVRYMDIQQYIEQIKQCIVQAHNFEYGEIIHDPDGDPLEEQVHPEEVITETSESTQVEFEVQSDDKVSDEPQ